ncbi:MAG: A/G-specific adenine glycosylase [Chthoniobacterales bacterium]|nr:A/G-specific adenine glycosylase [Chthoniobacterales bacterium]
MAEARRPATIRSVDPAGHLIARRRAFRTRLLGWYRGAGRDLPWRRTRDPYAILVSEVMLQQTQVATVIPYYSEWLRRFPSFARLAAASESDVLHAWQGLGYYARARNLHATAKAVAGTDTGTFPDSVAQMRNLPGLGRYTANAIATFAFGKSVPIVEANIGRLLSRLSNSELPIDSAAGAKLVWNVAGALVPKHDAHTFNSALMDLGAVICGARQPKCGMCPVRQFCRGVDPARLPLKRERAATKMLTEHHRFTIESGQLLLEQSQDRWRGMWILPRLREAPSREKPLYRSEFPFTHHRITLTVYRGVPVSTAPAHSWFPLESLETLPLPSPHRRAVSYLIARDRQNLCSARAAS